MVRKFEMSGLSTGDPAGWELLVNDYIGPVTVSLAFILHELLQIFNISL